MVTQELAKKKQNEYENSHFQSLQHIFILSRYQGLLKAQIWLTGAVLIPAESHSVAEQAGGVW